jgi:hypothetical protein
MEISSFGIAPQLAVTGPPLKPEQSDTKVAFGIGQDSTVELSAQGKILQQTEQAQAQRSANSGVNAKEQNSNSAGQNSDYVRVSSSVGTAQKNNLSSDQATEVYRSIEKLL